jgi:hypothetical protein
MTPDITLRKGGLLYRNCASCNEYIAGVPFTLNFDNHVAVPLCEECLKTVHRITEHATKGTNYSLSAKIAFTNLGASGNPKRPGTGAHELYAAYGKGNLTVGDYLKAAAKTSRPNAGRVALAWDVERGFITVS